MEIMKKSENSDPNIIEIYKLHCEITDNVSNRRSQTNQFFIAILSFLIGIVSFSSSKDIANNILEQINYIYVLVGFMGILLCILWIVNIQSYKKINSAKFKILHKIEEQLPFQFYADEWEELGGGKDAKKYIQLTRVEQYAPVILSIPFVVLIVFGFLK